MRSGNRLALTVWLALLYSDVGNDAGVEPLNKRAIAIMEKVFTP